MTHHDTAAIRSLASRLESAAASLSDTERSASSHIREINEDMCSDTNTEISAASGRLSEELNAIRGGLGQCAETLYRYARELDIADQKAQSLIRSN